MMPGMSAPFSTPQDARLLAEADLCVKCGLCLPHCPTYGDSQHEGDSPRGRIMLVQGLVTGLIEASPRMEMHLDGCLSCGRCDDVCPARVPYSHILDAGRARLAALRPQRTRITRLLGAMLVSPVGRAMLRTKWMLYRRSGLQGLVRRARLLGRGRLARLESMVPAPSTGMRSHEVPVPRNRDAGAGDAIYVFRGCATDLFERDAIHAVEVLLTVAGYAVERGAGQGCCGALHQHAGLPRQARACARSNLDAFAGAERIASLTTGCAATLRDYAELAPDEGGAAFAARVKEYSDWLLPRADRLAFAPLPIRVALHTPCTASSTVKSDAGLRALLARIPALEVVELDRGLGCCGAAGSHFITHPEESDRLLAPSLASIARIAPDLILSGNVGCSLHIAGGLTRSAAASGSLTSTAGSSVQGPLSSPPVLHPAQLLAQQLRIPPREPSSPRS